jgi:hypothetical protein
MTAELSHQPSTAPRRIAGIILQGCALGLLAGGICGYWLQRPKQEIIDDAVQDQIEEHGDTYVPVHSGHIERRTVHRTVSGYAKVTSAPFVEVQLTQRDLSDAKLGQPAYVHSAAIGSITLVKPESVEVALSPGVTLNAGQIVRVTIAVDEHANVLTVPAQSVCTDETGHTAIALLLEDGRWAVMLPVEVGLREGDHVEITGKGFEAGDAIVTEGTNGLIRRTRLHLLKD